MKKKIKNRIQFLRSTLSIHSYLYYHLGESIISDSKWDEWAYELVELQKEHGKIIGGHYDREFYDFDGSTGMHLPQDDWIKRKAELLLKVHSIYYEKLLNDKWKL